MSRRRRLRSDCASFSGCQQEIGHNQSAFKSPYRLFSPSFGNERCRFLCQTEEENKRNKAGEREREKRDHFPSLPDKSRVDPHLSFCVCVVCTTLASVVRVFLECQGWEGGGGILWCGGPERGRRRNKSWGEEEEGFHSQPLREEEEDLGSRLRWRLFVVIISPPSYSWQFALLQGRRRLKEVDTQTSSVSEKGFSKFSIKSQLSVQSDERYTKVDLSLFVTSLPILHLVSPQSSLKWFLSYMIT